MPRGDLVGRGSMLSIGGNSAGSKKNDSGGGGGVSYTSGGYLPVDTRYSLLCPEIGSEFHYIQSQFCNYYPKMCILAIGVDADRPVSPQLGPLGVDYLLNHRL